MKPIVSVVIPAFNVSKYISKTLESVLNQTFRDFEIVFVNDGSTDETESLARSILKSGDIPFKLITQPNRGVSVARNVATLSAGGHYIKYLDGDDLLDREALDELVKTCEEQNVSICFGKQDVVDVHGKTIYHFDEMYKVTWKKADHKTALNDFLKGFVHISCNAAIFRRDVIMRNSLFFTPGSKFGEDIEFVAKYIFYSKEVVFVDKLICSAVFRPASSTRNPQLSVFHNVGSFKRICKFFERVGEYDIVEVAKHYSIPSSYGWVLGNLAYNSFPYRSWIKIAKNNTVREMMRALKIENPYGATFQKNLRYLTVLYNFSPSLAYFVLSLVGRFHRWKYGET